MPESGISLLAVYDKVSSIDTKVEALMARVDERLQSGADKIDDHENRLRGLEQARWRAAGAYALISFATSGVVASLLVWALSRK